MQVQNVQNVRVKEEVRAIVAEVANLRTDFSETMHLYNELGIPSMAATEVLMRLEERFNISIPDEAFIEATTLGQLSDLVSRTAAE
jgi:acyl carrier protein